MCLNCSSSEFFLHIKVDGIRIRTNDLGDTHPPLFILHGDFVVSVFRSCEDIVRLRTQDRIASGDEMAEKELNDLQGLKVT